MKKLTGLLSAMALMGAAAAIQAEPSKDCMLEGTVYKSERGGEQQLNVKFHSAEKYDEDANCRVRRGEKLEFKLPEDTRLKQAPSGSSVKYRYQEYPDGSSETELVSVGTST